MKLKWKCSNCHEYFKTEQEVVAGTNVDAPMPKKATNVVVSERERLLRQQKEVTYNIGFKDQYGNEMVERQMVDGIIHEIWRNGKKKIFYNVWIPKNDKSGKELAKFDTIEEARNKIMELQNGSKKTS